MSNLVFALEEKLTGENKGGGNYPKAFHAYKAKITDVEENKGWINVKVEGINYTAGDYDALSFYADGKYTVEQIYKLANNVIASNEKMKGAVGMDTVDLSKWAGQDLKIGVVYKPAKRKDEVSGEYVETKWVEPAFSIPVDQVDDWEVDEEAYNAFMSTFWPATTSDTPNQETKPESSSKPPVEPVDQQLPF